MSTILYFIPDTNLVFGLFHTISQTLTGPTQSTVIFARQGQRQGPSGSHPTFTDPFVFCPLLHQFFFASLLLVAAVLGKTGSSRLLEVCSTKRRMEGGGQGNARHELAAKQASAGQHGNRIDMMVVLHTRTIVNPRHLFLLGKCGVHNVQCLTLYKCQV